MDKSTKDTIQSNEESVPSSKTPEAIHPKEQSGKMATVVNMDIPGLSLDSHAFAAAVAQEADPSSLDEHNSRLSKRSYGEIMINSTPTAKRTKRETSATEATIDTNNSGGNQWHAMYEKLMEYKAREGVSFGSDDPKCQTDPKLSDTYNLLLVHQNTLVPKRYKDSKLGTFVETQRTQYKRLERTVDPVTGEERVIPNKRLTAERLELLNAIDFAWTAKFVRRGPKAAATADSGSALQRKSAEQERRGETQGLPSKGKKIASSSTTHSSGGSGRSKDQWNEMYQRLVLVSLTWK